LGLGLHHDLTLYEASSHVGGHTATVTVEAEGGLWSIDTGFIVFNEWTYPNFVALLRELAVPWQGSNMSFSLRCENSGLEYNGTTMNTVFAQRRNLLRPSFLRMLTDILRFNATAAKALTTASDSLTLGEYLTQHRYSQQFIDLYVLPMGRAIWSASATAILSFPARFFVEFFGRHGFLSVNDRPEWLAVCGGSRNYVARLIAPFKNNIKLRAPVAGIKRHANHVVVRTAAGHNEHFDKVILACHADDALRLLDDPTTAEQEILGAFPYQANQVVLHTDSSLLPREPRARAAWNYHLLDVPQDRVALTYDMNRLMSLDSKVRFLVTMNRTGAIDPAKILREFTYDHPVYTPGAVQAQAQRQTISGVQHTYFAGAYWGAGFHEDGLVSGYAAAANIQQQSAVSTLREQRYA
jgi:uncharacterized protein